VGKVPKGQTSLVKPAFGASLAPTPLGLRIIDRILDNDPQAAHEALTRANEELSATLAELRELARGLHPAVLSDQGLELPTSPST
jgi:signal transduction histidine kinase